MSYKNPPKTTDLYHNLRILRMLVDIAMQQLRQKGSNNATES